MKITADVKVNLKFNEAIPKLNKATQLAMRDTVVDIHGDTIKNAKAVGFWLTGHNARSIAGEVSGMGVVIQGSDAEPERVVDDSMIEGAVYSTSGYGGWGEIGLQSKKYPPRPYFKPALDKNFTKEKMAEKIKGYL